MEAQLRAERSAWKPAGKAGCDSARGVEWMAEGGSVILRNTGGEPAEFEYSERFTNRDGKFLQIAFPGEILENQGACLYVNGVYNAVPLGSKVNIPVNKGLDISLSLKIFADSAARIDGITVTTTAEETDYTDLCDKSRDVLVVTPDYPSSANLYMCAFAHARNNEYAAKGLKIQVASISPYNWYQTVYTHGSAKVPVFRGRYADLKKLLTTRGGGEHYKVIVVHFADEHLLQIFDGLRDERLIFICHGPETIIRLIRTKLGNYFRNPNLPVTPERCDLIESYIRKYMKNPNADFVFVSQWLKEQSEEVMGAPFGRGCVIHNFISEELFPYHSKSAEDRKKILLLRKFDNCRQHAIDESVRAILELSHRPCFSDLTFDVYGDGDYYEELTAPLLQFPNVRLHRTFVPNDKIGELYKHYGILLIPSRHDAHAVSMGEAASSGLAVVGSAVTSNPYFMNMAENHTLAEPEDFIGLADIVERLYNNPDEFLAVSRRMASYTREICCRDKTVDAEIRLIGDRLRAPSFLPNFVGGSCAAPPLLSVVVPAYNVEKYVGRTLYTLLNHRNAWRTEIIVVDDGSTDGTGAVAERYAERAGGVVRVIHKENGGHGSAINAGLAAARGKYFRVVDGDDWVDSENLEKFIDLLEAEESDVVLTDASHEYADQPDLCRFTDYSMLTPGTRYRFDDLVYPNYGFSQWGPILPSANYRVEVLRKAGLRLSEHKPYTDMEYNAFAVRLVDTLTYYDIDVYRYFIGRENQTVSSGFTKSKYRDHHDVLMNIIGVASGAGYSAAKRRYVYEHIAAPMADSQIFLYDQVCRWGELDAFLAELDAFPDAKTAILEYVGHKNGDCAKILSAYKRAWRTGRRQPIISADTPAVHTPHGFERFCRLAGKAVIPYGLLRLYRKLRYNI